MHCRLTTIIAIDFCECVLCMCMLWGEGAACRGACSGSCYIIESVDSINRDERGFPLTQYITNWVISRARDFIMPSTHLPSSCYYILQISYWGWYPVYYCALLEIRGKHQRVVQKSTCAHLKLTGKYAFG